VVLNAKSLSGLVNAVKTVRLAWWGTKPHHPGRRKLHRAVLTVFHWTETSMPFPGKKSPLRTGQPAWPKTENAMQGLNAIQQELSLPLLGQLSVMIHITAVTGLFRWDI